MSNGTPSLIEGQEQRTRMPSFRDSAVPSHHRVVAATAGLRGGLLFAILWAAGCQGAAPSGSAAHHAPEHRPADFPAAVTRLGELHREIVQGLRRPAGELDVFGELGDLIRWLPEMAADSDLPEEPWNRVAATSDALTRLLAGIRAASPDRRTAEYQADAARWQQALDELTQMVELPPAQENRS